MLEGPSDYHPPKTQLGLIHNAIETAVFPSKNPQELADEIMRTPSIAPTLLHALWRTNRDEDIRVLGANVGRYLLEDSYGYQDFVKNMGEAYANLRILAPKNIRERRTFIHETVENLIRGMKNLPPGQLDQQNLNAIESYKYLIQYEGKNYLRRLRNSRTIKLQRQDMATNHMPPYSNN